MLSYVVICCHMLSYVVICCHMLSYVVICCQLDDLERHFQIHMFAFKSTGQEIKGLSKVSRHSDTGLTSASPSECSGDLQPKRVHRQQKIYPKQIHQVAKTFVGLPNLFHAGKGP